MKTKRTISCGPNNSLARLRELEANKSVSVRFVNQFARQSYFSSSLKITNENNGQPINHVQRNLLEELGCVMSRAVGPRPWMCVVIQHARHDVLLVGGVASKALASLVIVMGHIQSVNWTNDDDRLNIHQIVKKELIVRLVSPYKFTICLSSHNVYINWYVLLYALQVLQIYRHKTSIYINLALRAHFTSWLTLM